VPGYVEGELRGYLTCGILCFGFARAVCTTCRTRFVMAFSCKGRGVCPSCNGRHMAQTAPHRADHVIPPPRKHRHRYHGVFALNHKLRRAVTGLAIGNIGKPRDSGAGGHAGNAHATGCCDTQAKPRSHDTSRIAWAKLMARLGEEFPLECPACGGDIRLIAFRQLSECETIPGLRTLGNLQLLRTSCPRSRGRSGRSSRIWANRSSLRQSLPPAARPPTGESSCRSTFDRAIFQASPVELPAIDIHSL
jgi:hypothetical protein